MRARGKNTMYAPRVAAIAPDAPIVGIVGVRRHGDLGQRRRDPAAEVEEQERDAAEPVLDVVREDPQVEQVAHEVQPAAVEELARDERRGLLRRGRRRGPTRRSARPGRRPTR